MFFEVRNKITMAFGDNGEGLERFNQIYDERFPIRIHEVASPWLEQRIRTDQFIGSNGQPRNPLEADGLGVQVARDFLLDLLNHLSDPMIANLDDQIIITLSMYRRIIETDVSLRLKFGFSKRRNVLHRTSLNAANQFIYFSHSPMK